MHSWFGMFVLLFSFISLSISLFNFSLTTGFSKNSQLPIFHSTNSAINGYFYAKVNGGSDPLYASHKEGITYVINYDVEPPPKTLEIIINKNLNSLQKMYYEFTGLYSIK